MKLLLGLLVVILAVVVAAERSSISLTPLPFVTRAQLPGGPFLPLATKKDLLVYMDSDSYLTYIRRRNNAGDYVTVANFTSGFSSPLMATNGKWVVLYSMGNTLFSVDANNEVSESSTIITLGGDLLSDDTFVGFDPNRNEESGNYFIRTFEYNADGKNWTSIAGTELEVPSQSSMGGPSTYRASDTHLTLLDVTNENNVTIKLYERLADRSWSPTDTVLVKNASLSNGANVMYNGVDTILYSAPAITSGDSIGQVTLFTKTNGQWVEQTFTTESVGYRPSGFLGYQAVFLDANTLLLTAALEGAPMNTPPVTSGKVLMLTRNSNGQWQPALDLVGGGGIFGIGVGANDYDIVVSALTNEQGTLSFHVLPRCFYEPINVTCYDQQVSDCSDVSSAGLYTINNPQCGAITATLKGFSLVDNQALSAEFTFSRAFGEEYTCEATVTCPAPPVVPIAPPTKNTSGANALQLGFGLALTVAAILFA